MKIKKQIDPILEQYRQYQAECSTMGIEPYAFSKYKQMVNQTFPNEKPTIDNLEEVNYPSRKNLIEAAMSGEERPISLAEIGNTELGKANAKSWENIRPKRKQVGTMTQQQFDKIVLNATVEPDEEEHKKYNETVEEILHQFSSKVSEKIKVSSVDSEELVSELWGRLATGESFEEFVARIYNTPVKQDTIFDRIKAADDPTLVMLEYLREHVSKQFLLASCNGGWFTLLDNNYVSILCETPGKALLNTIENTPSLPVPLVSTLNLVLENQKEESLPEENKAEPETEELTRIKDESLITADDIKTELEDLEKELESIDHDNPYFDETISELKGQIKELRQILTASEPRTVPLKAKIPDNTPPFEEGELVVVKNSDKTHNGLYTIVALVPEEKNIWISEGSPSEGDEMFEIPYEYATGIDDVVEVDESHFSKEEYFGILACLKGRTATASRKFTGGNMTEDTVEGEYVGETYQTKSGKYHALKRDGKLTAIKPETLKFVPK